MAKPIFTYDCDDVILLFLASANTKYNERHGTNFKVTDYKSYVFSETWGCSEEYAHEFMDELFANGELYNLPEHPGATEAMTLLFEGAKESHLVTSRKNEQREGTLQNILEATNKQFTDAHFAEYGVGGNKHSKADICKSINANILIEDNRHYANLCAPVLDKVYLLDKPWNQGRIAQNVVRVPNWECIVIDFYKNL